MIFFTDIDGVLVTSKEVNKKNTFNKKCVRAFNSLCGMFDDPKIVITSFWRIGKSLDQLKELFKENGIIVEVISKIEDEYKKIDDQLIPVTKDRGKEILEWIEKNKYTGKYIVMDDEINDIKNHIPLDNILHIRGGLFRKGLSKEKVRNFKRFLLEKFKK